MIETYSLEFNETLYLLWFTNVQNEKKVFEKLTKAVKPFSNCTIINPKLIVEPFQILIAANKAVIAKHDGTLITKSLPTELLYNLSISDNISQSLTKFGYSSNNRENLFLAVFQESPDQLQNIISEIQGTLQQIGNMLPTIRDIDLIKNSYDVTDEQLLTNNLIDLVVTKLACKSV